MLCVYFSRSEGSEEGPGKGGAEGNGLLKVPYQGDIGKKERGPWGGGNVDSECSRS